EYALAKLLESWGIRPTLMIGHSVGEYVAACLSGVFPLRTALRLLASRGRIMQSMQPGRMLSVALSTEKLQPLLGSSVNIAAINPRKACVFAGPAAAIEDLERQLTAQTVPYHRLKTSHAFHSFMMDSALEPFRHECAKDALQKPSIPYILNVTGSFAAEDQVRNPEYWCQQLRQPVLFAKGIQTLMECKAGLFLEVGPGRHLSALALQCGVEADGAVVVDTMPDAHKSAPEDFWLTRTLGKLWLAGISVDWDGLNFGEKR